MSCHLAITTRGPIARNPDAVLPNHQWEVFTPMMTPSPSNPLARSGSDSMIAGVCGGIAEWLDWDPTLVRVLYVAISFFSAAFPGLLVYIILWIVMPRR